MLTDEFWCRKGLRSTVLGGEGSRAKGTWGTRSQGGEGGICGVGSASQSWAQPILGIDKLTREVPCCLVEKCTGLGLAPGLRQRGPGF